MRRCNGLTLFAICFGLPLWLAAPGYGVPGQSVNDAKTWMQGHPTLRADSREGLRVHRTEVPSRRFTFQASVFPIGGVQQQNNATAWPDRRVSVIRREEFTLVDYDKDVTMERLEEALRAIYGADIYADYRRSELMGNYQSDAKFAQGEIRLGGLYGYWLEIITDDGGRSSIGKLNVMLPEDINRLQSYLQ